MRIGVCRLWRGGCRGLMGWRGDGASLPVKGNSGHFLKFYQYINNALKVLYGATVVVFTLFRTTTHYCNPNFYHMIIREKKIWHE